MTATTLPLARERRPLTTVGLVAAVTAGGLAVGALTSVGQTWLPGAISSLANSASGWVVPVFGLVWLARLRPVAAAIAGPLAFTAMMIGYNLVSELRGFTNGSLLGNMYVWAGLLIGPVIGVSASLLRSGPPVWRMLAVAPLTAVLVSEGVFGLVLISDTTSPVYWTIVLVLGIGFLVWQLVRQRPRPLLGAAAVGLSALGAAVLWVVYNQAPTWLTDLFG